MHNLKNFLLSVLLLSCWVANATPTLNNAPNSLPAPAWIQAVEITESKIKVQWAPVSGAVEYKISRFDVTNNVQLPDVYEVEDEYTSQPHNPGTTIQFEVVAIDINGQEGAAITGEYTTSIIIVDVIASFSVPNTPGGTQGVLPGTSMELSLSNADKTESSLNVMRVKMSFQNYFAEFLVWSHCIDQENPGTRIQYYQENNWPTGVSKVEIGVPDQGYSEIQFYIGSVKFFSLRQPSYVLESDQAKLVIKNDLKNSSIVYQRSNNMESNPCYVPPAFQVPESPETLHSDDYSNDRDEANTSAGNDQQASLKSPLSVSPNPFQDALKVEYLVAQPGEVRLFMSDLTGRLIQNIAFDHLESGAYTAYLTSQTLPSGLYLITVQTESGRSTIPVIKH